MTALTAAIACLLAAFPDGERLKCTADTTIAIYQKEQDHNRGGKSSLRMKGIEDIALLRFDVAPVRGRTVREARLFLRKVSELKLTTVSVSSVSSPWEEGKSKGPARPGEPCFLEAARGQRPWAYPGSDFLAVSFGKGGSIWFVRDVREEKDGWVSIDVPPALVHALVEGASTGIAIGDEKGQTRNGNSVYSREQSRSEPYLLIVKSDPGGPPASGAKLYAAADVAPPVDRISGILPKYETVGPPAERLMADGCSFRILHESATHARTGASGRVWNGRQVSLASARGAHVGFSVAVRMPSGESRAVRFSGDGWSVRRLLPVGNTHDPLVPVAGEAKGTALYHVERYVAKSAAPGNLEAPLVLSTGKAEVDIPVRIRVYGAMLPDRLGFHLSLNAYKSPGYLSGGGEDSPEFLAMERAMYRLSHEHRAALNVLPYSQRGRVDEGFAPKTKRGGGVFSWAEWDARFGPYFDGSAFKGLPRGETPIDHFYLPIHESWPLRLDDFYTWKGKTEDHWKDAPAVEKGFGAGYAEGFASMVEEMGRHFVGKGWTRTDFHVYLNNKPYIRYKRGEDEGAWWHLDEPVYRDDFLALRYYGELFRKGNREVANSPVRFRIDLSRPQWRRDYLDGVVDLNVINGRYRRYPRYVFGLGEEVWVYGTVPVPGKNASGAEAWMLQVFLDGADGLMPWNTFGSDKAWSRPEGTALFLRPRPGMKKEYVPTLRLKILRRGQQTVELLRLLLAKKKWKREEIRKGAAAALGLKGEFKMTHSDDAGQVDFGGLSPDRFEFFRRALLAALE